MALGWSSVVQIHLSALLASTPSLCLGVFPPTKRTQNSGESNVLKTLRLLARPLLRKRYGCAFARESLVPGVCDFVDEEQLS
jgi:hypothetical protein